MTTQQVTTLPTFGGPVSSKLQGVTVENELGAGIAGSYGIMKYKGKVWTTSYKGEDRPLMRPDGDGPRNSIDVVIVRAPKVKSKIFYAGGFAEGSSAAPDCWSTNGVTPDTSVVHKQANVCDICPKNQWGSARPRADGTPSKGKACTDSKRIAIVPANVGADDPNMLRNDMMGGAMLLRIPATSLDALKLYGDRLAKSGYNSWAVITSVSFDPMEAYPKFVFTPKRPLTDAELEVVMGMHKSPQVDRIVAEDAPGANASDEPVQFTAPLPTQLPPAPATVAPPKLTVVPPTPPVAPVTPQVTETGLPQSFEAQLDALLK